jgi:CHAT domain-containing protein
MPFLGIGAIGSSALKILEAKQIVASSRSASERGVFDEQGGHLSPLPGGLDELVSAAKTARSSATLLLGDEATEAAVKRLPLDRYRVIHIAAHATVDTAYPDRSAVILSTSNTGREDGLLQAREIRGMRLNTDLVAVPACDTAVGRLEGQAGVVNLIQAFLLAGSKSVLGSLWSVDDAATGSVMKRFYFHLSQGLDKGAALQRAKLDFLKRYEGRIAPFYWAGLILSGDSIGEIRF